jgi:hypothetical protein
MLTASSELKEEKAGLKNTLKKFKVKHDRHYVVEIEQYCSEYLAKNA